MAALVNLCADKVQCVTSHVLSINPDRTESASEIPSLRKTVMKYNLEECFIINVQMKVIDLEFLILSIWLNSPMLS
jgi:hypothetical protein